jgi:gluconokinase
VLILLMGVSGSGKSTIGALLAGQLGWPFIEGDRFHPPENIEKMRSGRPLTDDDRAPWLTALRDEIDRRIAAGESAVLACSALRRSYRQTLARGHEASIAIVHLSADEPTIRERMRQREHYMKPQMLDSQLAALEPPEPGEAVVIDVTLPPKAAAAEIRRRLNLGQGEANPAPSQSGPLR